MKVRLGIDLGGSFIKAGIVSGRFKALLRLTSPSGAEHGALIVRKNLKDICGRLLDACRDKNYRPASIGIGSPGTVSQPDGKVMGASPNIAGWEGRVLTNLLGDMGLSVFADNDANCAALGEYLAGFNCRYKNMVFVTVGTGIGGGLIIDGKLHRGESFAAGEIGHSILKYDGKPCKCGQRGCLESYASVPNIIKRAYYWAKRLNVRIKPDINAVELFALFKNGNRAALRAVRENADYLGTSLASLVNIFNPEIVVIGGGFSASGNEYIKLIKDSIMAKSFKSATFRLKVEKARLGNDAGFIGASALGLLDDDGYIKKT